MHHHSQLERVTFDEENDANTNSPESFSSHQSDSSATESELVDSSEISGEDSDDDTLHDDDVEQHNRIS